MFESSIEKATRERKGLKLRYLPLALVLHLLVLTGVLVSQVWTVSAVADPPLYATFRVALPPPSPPPGGSKPKVQPDQPTKPAAPTTPTQLEDVPTTTPTSVDLPSSPSSNEVAGDEPSVGGEGDGPGPGFGDGPGLEPAPPEPDLDIPVELTGDMTPPVVIHRVAPRYTQLAIAVRKTGTVVVQATITRDGDVTNVRVLKALGFGLDDAAASAVRQWKFKPAERFGRPAAVLYNLTVKFELR